MPRATAPALDRWEGGVCPFDAGWRKVMMWWFIVTDGLLFAGFLASYGYARILTSNWPDQSTVFSLPYIAGMTFVLISSSATMAGAVESARQRRWDMVLKFTVATAIGGAAFLGMQAYEWTHLIHEGLTLSGNPWGTSQFGTTFFMTTGFHGCHVFGGVCYLSAVCIKGLRGGYSRTNYAGVETAGLYWHFVDLIWILVFTFIYLI